MNTTGIKMAKHKIKKHPDTQRQKTKPIKKLTQNITKDFYLSAWIRSICAAILLFVTIICVYHYSKEFTPTSIYDAKAPRVLDKNTNQQSHHAKTTAMIAGNNVIIRETPKINGKIITRAIFGISVDIIEEDGKWVRINNPGQHVTGWVEKVYLNY